MTGLLETFDSSDYESNGDFRFLVQHVRSFGSVASHKKKAGQTANWQFFLDSQRMRPQGKPLPQKWERPKIRETVNIPEQKSLWEVEVVPE